MPTQKRRALPIPLEWHGKSAREGGQQLLAPRHHRENIPSKGISIFHPWIAHNFSMFAAANNEK